MDIEKSTTDKLFEALVKKDKETFGEEYKLIFEERLEQKMAKLYESLDINSLICDKK